MGLINYKDIDFNQSINKETKKINFNGSEIEIVNYLSISDKNDLIMLAIQNSFDDGIYNQIKLDMYFDLYLIYMYTNIVFDVEDRADEETLYDILSKSGLIQLVKNNINVDELNILNSYLWKTLDIMTAYKKSIASVILDLVDNLNEKIKEGIETLNEINPELIQKISGTNPKMIELLKGNNSVQ